MTSGRVLVVGSINEDVVLRVTRAPSPGETVSAEEVKRSPGGKGANQAVAAARAGAVVAMAGRVGDDDAGERMLAALHDEDVDTEHVTALSGTATGTAYITVTAEGENTIVIDPGANGAFAPDALDEDLLAGAAVMLAQLEIPVETVSRAVALARDAGARAVVTLAPAQPVPDALLRGLDPLLVNEHEAAFLLGEDQPGDPERAAQRLRARGPRSVVITLGGEGAVLVQEAGTTRLPAEQAQRVLDTTGAGDAFAGALAAELARGAELTEAVRAGLAAGAEAVARPGAR